MTDRSDVEDLMDAVDSQIDVDVHRAEVNMAVFQGRSFTVDHLLDVWNKEDLSNVNKSMPTK